MASFSDTVKVLIDVDSTGAVSGLANFRKSFSEAETATDKFKVVTGGAFDAIKNNAGTLALGAGTAIAGFALKAIGDFQDMALAVDDFRNKTNLTLEQSSRWNALADDLGVPSDAITKIFDKLGKAADQQIPAFDRLGVAVQFGPDGATDIEATFLKVISKLQEIEDPAARAKIQADLFGKGWTNAAELINMSADDIKTALAGVGEAEIIDEEEIQKAKDLRAAQDALGDAFAAVSIKLGEALIPALTLTLEVLTPLLEALELMGGTLDQGFGDAIRKAQDMGKSLSDIARELGANDEKSLRYMADVLGISLDDLYSQLDRDLIPETYLLEKAWKEGTRALIDARTATDELENSTMDLDTAIAELKGEVDERQAWRNLIDTLEDAGEAAIRAFAEQTPDSLRASEDKLDDARLKVAEYIASIEEIPEDQRTDFIAALNTASLDEVERILNEAARMREVAFLPTIRPGAGGINEVGAGGRPIGAAPLPVISGLTPRISNFGSSTAGSVTVNVGGSVVTQTDLVEQIRLGLISAQRSGKQLVYTGP